MKKLLVFLVIVLAIIAGAYYFISTSKDLGVAWNEQDYQSYLTKMGITGDAGQTAGSKDSTSTGTQKDDGSGNKSKTDGSAGTTKASKPYHIDTSFTNSEISAMVSREVEATNGPVKDVRVKFLPGNQLEATFVTTDKLISLIPQNELTKYKIAENLVANRPVYVKMQVEKASDKTIRLNLEDAKVGRIGVPQGTLTTVQNAIESAVNTQLSQLSNFSIDQLSFDDNAANFKGNLQSVPRKLD